MRKRCTVEQDCWLRAPLLLEGCLAVWPWTRLAELAAILAGGPIGCNGILESSRSTLFDEHTWRINTQRNREREEERRRAATDPVTMRNGEGEERGLRARAGAESGAD